MERSEYEEIEHTADYAIRVRGADLPGLFISAAQGMIALTGGAPGVPSLRREIELEAPDLETLLVTWLEELAFLLETDGELYTRFEMLVFSPTALRARAEGGEADGVSKLIKAVTFHDLSIRETDIGYETIIVFDV